MDYWLSKQLNITFSPYEDRLILRAERGEHGVANVLLTRRMAMIVLQRLLVNLTELTGLQKTPAQHWQEVLQMAHQQAMQAKRDADSAQAAAPAPEPSPASADDASAETVQPPALYLATELTTRLQDKELAIAFTGLPMPQAMTQPSTHEPVFAMVLQAEHIHQVIELLITKAQEAQWHLPLTLPWLESPARPETGLGGPTVH